MGRRFGRNQRRRAREALAAGQDELASMTLANAMNQSLAHTLSGKLGALREELIRAKAIAGRMSVLFPAQPEPAVSMPAQWRGSVFLSDESPRGALSLDAEEVLSAKFQMLPLDMLVARIHPDALREALHAHVAFGKDELVYGMTEAARRALPADVLEHDLTLQIAQQIAAGFARMKKGRRSMPTHPAAHAA